MALKRYANVIGIDDAPFDRRDHDPVPVVGVVYAGLRLDGVVMDHVARDGNDATTVVTRMVRQSPFEEHIQLVMLQGIALAGFNVIDAHQLHGSLDGRPVLVVARKAPRMEAIRAALHRHIPEGAAKWQAIEALGPMEPMGPIFIQRVGLDLDQAREVLRRFTVHSQLPEPIRVAHLVAGAVGRGHSRGRA